MKLCDKIYFYRKRIGKSQEALAEELGVSRQAVSKWETGESEPELSKIMLLAQAFGVTVDVLLSAEDPQEGAVLQDDPAEGQGKDASAAFPGWLGRLLRRYGWLGGVYIAVAGVFIMLMSGAVFLITNIMTGYYEESLEHVNVLFGPSFGGGSFGGASPTMPTFPSAAMSVMGWLFLIIGVSATLGGVLLAVYLRRKGRK